MKTHGIFDIDSMLVYFFSEDGKNHASDCSRSPGDLFEAAYARRNQQTYTFKHLYALEEEISINLFHELVHSWQALSSPMIILNFLNVSKKLRANAERLNLYLPRISNTYLFFDDDDPNIDFAYKSHRMNFIQRKEGRKLFRQIKKTYEAWRKQGYSASWTDFVKELKSQLETKYKKSIYDLLSPDLDMVPHSYNIVADEPPLAMPFLIYGHEKEGERFASFGALIDYFDMVYFTGDNLMEAFASINDYLRKSENIPPYNPLKEEDNMYLGVYEAYRRMHKHRYETEKELALSFLALVDLAFLNDPMGVHDDIYEYDNSFRNENVSLPYRFGNLIYKARGFRPFKIKNDDVANSLKEWQDDYCRYLGYFLPDDGIRNMVCAILSSIINDASVYYRFSDESKILKTLTQMTKNTDNWNECLQYLLDEINKMYRHLNGAKLTSQHHMLVMIVNALLFRQKHRGEMTAPCFYSNQILGSLENLLFVYNGEYYGIPFDNYNDMPLKQMDVGHYSLLDLMVLKPMAKEGINSCGFLSSFIPCRFQHKGMGCPLIGLSDDEKKRRASIGLDYDWCHRKCVMNELDKNIKYTHRNEDI